MKSSHKTLLLILLLLMPALLYGLGDRPISKIQEVRIAESAREMLVTGDLLVPRYNGELRLQKPPLPYWGTVASYQIAGVGATAVRLPSVLFGLLAAVLLYYWCCRMTHPQIGANTVLVLMTSYIGIRYFRSGEADAMLLFFISTACILGYEMIYGSANSSRRFLFGIVLGLGFLTKGPAALAIPLLTLFVVTMLEKQPSKFKKCFNISGLAMLVLIGFGWYGWMLWKLPDAAQHFFSNQMDETFVSGTHSKPPWWYLQHLFEYFAPWGILLVPAAWWSYQQRKMSGALPPPLRFAWIWLVVAYVLLMLTINKQPQYVLLLAPPLAIIVGHYLASAKDGFARTNRVLFWIFCLATAAVTGYAMLHSPAGLPASFGWLGLLLIPLALKRFFRIEAPSMPIMIVAAATCLIYHGSESFSDELRNSPAQTLMSKAVNYAPLYQSSPGNGAVSFYAGCVVPPIGNKDISAALRSHAAIWLVAEDKPTIPGLAVELVEESGELKLFRLKY